MKTAFDYVTQTLEISREPGENLQDFLQRVAFELQGLTEEKWNELPEELQDWYNKAADAIASASDDEAAEIELIPGMKVEKAKKAKKVEVEEELEEDEDEEEGEEEEEEDSEKEVEEEVEEEVEVKQKAKRGRKPKEGSQPRLKKAPKEPKKPKEPKAPKEPKEPKGPTAANAVREILCENMDLGLDEIMQKLEERGVVMKRSSMQVVALNTKQAFVIAVQKDVVKNSQGVVVLHT